MKKYIGFLNAFIDSALNIGRKADIGRFCTPAEEWASMLYSVVMYLIGVVFFLRSIIYAIKIESMSMIWMGLGVLVGSVLFVYIGDKVMSVTRGLYSKTSSKFRSPAILDCIALVFVLQGIGGFVMGLKMGMGFTGVLIGVCSLILSLLVAVAALYPSVLAIEVDGQSSAGEEFIGLLTFFMKSVLFLLPFAVFIGGIAMLWFLLFQLGIAAEYSMAMVAMIPVICGIGLAPLAVYLVYLSYYFMLDVCRAILSIPEKLDKLNR